MPDAPATPVVADAPTTDTPAAAPAAAADPPADLGDPGKKALDAERAARGVAEKRAKAAEAELDKARKASMSDQEKAVSEAEARGRSAVTVEVGQRLAAAEIRVALTGVVPDPAATIEDLNLARYVDETGEVDVKAVAALAERYKKMVAGATPAPPPGPGSADGGARGPGATATVTRDQLKTMSQTEIARLSPAVIAAAMSA